MTVQLFLVEPPPPEPGARYRHRDGGELIRVDTVDTARVRWHQIGTLNLGSWPLDRFHHDFERA